MKSLTPLDDKQMQVKLHFLALITLTCLILRSSACPVSFIHNPFTTGDDETDTVNHEKNYTEIKPDNGKSAFPAEYIYENIWNTTKPNPYPDSLTNGDSILKITLIPDSSQFHFPGEGRITSSYGWRDGKFHEGIDLDVYHGLPVYAVFPGVIRMARSFGGYGRIIIIRHDNGLETFYAHLGTIKVKAGQRINAGDIIGTSGNSGHSRGTHLHFEVRLKGKSINPEHMISFPENTLKMETVLLRMNESRYFVYYENAVMYKIKRGDYLHKIAQEYGTSVKRIRETNNIPKNGMLRCGQLICICM